jgi:aspartyl/asparaginyl-tRNA synthetase
VFCITTSYRNEPNPVEGRHDKIFPMFEFESHGDMGDLMNLESGLLHHLGFGEGFPAVKYEEASKKYGVSELEYDEEEALCRDNGNVVFLTDFPQRTHPFWNMKHSGGGIYNKVDVIMHGMETIGSAERSCDTYEMRKQFQPNL